MKNSVFRRFPTTVLAAAVFGTGALSLLPAHAADAAAAAARANVRGQVVNLNGNTLVVKSREGKTVNITLSEGWKVAGVSRADVADIKPGAFVGIASLPKSAGGDGALEVLVFPAAMKGLGEGSYAWDLKPNSNMTNATVANAVKDVDGHTVTVSYHGKEKKIAIADGTPIVTLGPATPADLKPGAVVFVPTTRDAKGAIVAQQVVVGTNGIVPPM